MINAEFIAPAKRLSNTPPSPVFATWVSFLQKWKVYFAPQIISVLKESSKEGSRKKKHMINQEFIAPSIFLSPSPAFSGLQGFLFLSLGHWGTRTCVLLSLCRMSQWWFTCLMKTTENTKNQIDTEFTTQFIDFHTAYGMYHKR